MIDSFTHPSIFSDIINQDKGGDGFGVYPRNAGYETGIYSTPHTVTHSLIHP